nr:hypothetical protein [Myxococcota bacterium]
ASALNSGVNDRRARRPSFCFFMEHSSRILALSGVSARRGEAHTLRWARFERAAVGLDHEFARAVVEALKRELATSSPVSVRVRYAACSAISSSCNTMGALALAVVRLARMSDPDDAALAACVMRAIRTPRAPTP